MSEENNTKNLRIDYSKYQVDEVVDTIADAILFPLYIGKVVGVTLLVGLVLIGCLSSINTSHWLLAILFFLLMFIISFPSIVIISIIRLIKTIISDINNVLTISIETTKHVYEDSGLLREQNKSGVELKSSFMDVFRGVALYVIRPSLKRVLEKRLGKLSFIFTFIIDRLFKYIIIKKQPPLEVSVINDSTGSHIEVQPKTLDEKIIHGTNKVTSISGKIIKFPFYLALFIYGSINLFLYWILTAIF